MPNGLAHPTIIDLVTCEPGQDHVTLVIVQDAEWPRGEALQKAFAHKVNTYLSFAKLGTMFRDFPESQGRALRVQVMAKRTPTPEARAVMKMLGPLLKQQGARLDIVEMQ
jgi:hypothetical protein